CCKQLGVKNSTASFILPLGATVNMNGNSMLYGLLAMFFAQMFNIELGPVQYIGIVLTSVLGAVGTAGVPGPSLLVVAVLATAGIPVVALPLVFGIDRIMDMMRTSTNILGDASCAVIMENILSKDENQ
ncbi:MAG: dicarboxylate/amino acid:cation symporter, partial [Cetobacterium sp.]